MVSLCRPGTPAASAIVTMPTSSYRVDQVGSKGRVLVKWDVDSESKDCRAIFK
jgi:hypothetical protein